MIMDGRTLVVVADGARAQVFEEARRGGRLVERGEWLAGLAAHRSGHGASPGRVYDRRGHAFHGVTTESPRDKSERNFEIDLVHRLTALAQNEPFDHLVIIAAPRALGVIREALPDALQRRLRETEASDRVGAGAEEIRLVLRALRQSAVQ